jgi:hypothetical protein
LGGMVHDNNSTVFQIFNHKFNSIYVPWVFNKGLWFLIFKHEICFIQFFLFRFYNFIRHFCLFCKLLIILNFYRFRFFILRFN